MDPKCTGLSMLIIMLQCSPLNSFELKSISSFNGHDSWVLNKNRPRHRWLTLWRMLLQLYRRRVWVRSAQLLEVFANWGWILMDFARGTGVPKKGSSSIPGQALPNMPDEIKEDDLLATWAALQVMDYMYCTLYIVYTYLI